MSIKIERELITPKEYKSYILSNSDIINKSKVIINNSTSKAMYSFPLTERFEKKIDDYSSFFYNIPSTLNNRKAFIGYGPRSSILLSRRGKTDNYYDIPSSINPFNKSIMDENLACAGFLYFSVSLIWNSFRTSSKSGISKSDPSPPNKRNHL